MSVSIFAKDAIEHAKKIRKNRGISASNLDFHTGGLETVKNKSFDLVICCEGS